GEDLLASFDEVVTKTATAFDGVRLEAPSWNPAPLAKTAEFWFRRLMCETAVHRWDAQMAAAATEPIEGLVAAEGIEEVFDAFIPMGRRQDDSTPTGVLQLFATDIDRQWFVRLREGRESLLDPDSVDVDNTAIQASASATASDLYLALWGRIPVDALDLAGADSLFRAVRIH
ncbi:MAG: maleylpyruvate isomerase N-terminal domain-containing protein, partial [Stackebrandtia sp.]